MPATSIIFRRELAAYLRSPVGWIIAAIFLLATGLTFQVFAMGKTDHLSATVLRQFFWGTSGITIFTAAVLSFRLIAEERQTQSLVLLNTSPIHDVDIVLGKFLAALVLLGGMLALSIYMPLLIMLKGKIATSQVVVGYLGLTLLGAAVLAIGVFASALTRHILIAAVITVILIGTMLLLYLLGKVLDPPLAGVVRDLDLWTGHFQGGFMTGVLNLKDIVYYLAIIYFFLLLAVKTLEAKRWQ